MSSNFTESVSMTLESSEVTMDLNTKAKEKGTSQNEFHKTLNAQLDELRQLNKSRYTLRALAKRINVSHSMLSQILSGKKIPSVPLAKRICSELNLSDRQQNQIINEVVKCSQLGKKYSAARESSFGRPNKSLFSQNPIEIDSQDKHVIYEKAYSTADLENIDLLSTLLRTEIFEIMSRVGSHEIPENARIVLLVERPNGPA